MKAIQTQYRGYRLRSRLEARWAVFFDALALPWQYEPEGFELDDGEMYLPDFFVPSIGWFEIKPSAAIARADSDRLNRTLEGLAGAVESPVYLVVGEPMVSINLSANASSYGDRVPLEDGIEGYWRRYWANGCDFPYLFCVCPTCGKVGVEFDGRGNRVCGGHGSTNSRGYTGHDRRLIAAATKARSARFEHEERQRMASPIL